ncbi:primase-helicase family protein, partial [Thiolapillus sp.]|uniref:primase-helicase family protein n=2 Tax=Thiolapillus sp. TaxID=2017437 RepID=UPI003AF92D09
MGTNARYVDGSNLSKDFNEYLLNTKLLVVNETETGDYKDAKEVARDLKPLLAAPPMTLEVNIKHIRPVLIRNILNVVMTSNSLLPVQSHDSRRLFPIWSDFKPRDASGRPYEDVQKFWSRYWPWMKEKGWRHVAYHLLHEVDLSDFDAGEPPPVTAFLQEIQHYSMTNWEELVVTSFRENEAFRNRTVFTSKEIVDTAALYAGEHQMSVKLPGNKLIARYLRTCPEFIAIRTRGSMIWTRNNLEGRILATKGHIRAHEVLLAEMSAQED